MRDGTPHSGWLEGAERERKEEELHKRRPKEWKTEVLFKILPDVLDTFQGRVDLV